MIRLFLGALALFALAGCGGASPSRTAEANAPAGPGTNAAALAARADSAAADVPKLIARLSNETEVFSCPKCFMDYDRAGMCTMCDVVTIRTRIDYTCPADGQPVEHAGHCPRCPMDARIDRTPLTATLNLPEGR